jgi:hypothetical protein
VTYVAYYPAGCDPEHHWVRPARWFLAKRPAGTHVFTYVTNVLRQDPAPPVPMLLRRAHASRSAASFL